MSDGITDMAREIAKEIDKQGQSPKQEKESGCKFLAAPHTIGELKKAIENYSDDIPFGFRNQPFQELYIVTDGDDTFISFDDLRFEYNKPFRTKNGKVITMKALVTVVSVRCNESHTEYKPDQLTPMTHEEYKAYLDDEDPEEK